MCCGGTVPTTVAGSAGSSPKASPASRLRAASAPQVLAWATGSPVLPEVNTSAASWPAAIAGIAAVPVPAAARHGRQRASGPASRQRDAPGTAPAMRPAGRGERSLVSRLGWPRSSAAANPTAKA